jgi:2-iminobutanoate/2-iminopropanoate deaminase
MREQVQTSRAPAAIGPYSQAVRVTEPAAMMFVSGQIALLPGSGEMVMGSVAEETRQVLTNLAAVVEAGGFALADVAKTTIFLSDMAHYPTVNEIYAEFFGACPPARAAVAVAGLPKWARVEIEAVCLK